jgi:glucose/arabinose dehydrogenase/cytochrome c551/c552
LSRNKNDFLLMFRWCILAGVILSVSPHMNAQKGVKTYSVNKEVIKKGEALFQQHCAECHNFNQRGIGPNLAGVTGEASPDYLAKFIVNPQQVVKSGNKRASLLFKEYKVPMPAHPQLTASDINAILSFINTRKKATASEKVTEPATAIDNPVSAKIPKAGLTLKLEEFTTAPVTSDKNPLTRINQTFMLKGETKRLFMLDLRGKLYEIKGKNFNVVMDMAKEKPAFINEPGLGTGWGSYAFHPEFYKNGLLYTTHAEKKGSAPADYAYADSIPVGVQWVVSEWKIKDPSADVFTGECRELLRINNPSVMHSVQQIIFNPLSKPGDADYGLLYIGVGDGGSAENGYPQLCNDNTQIRSSVLRIDPAGRNSLNGKYGIPAINPYANDNNPKTLGEIFARGLRNPNRITWTPDGKMIISEIGFSNVEEINLGKAGADYGWPAREGTFVLNLASKTNKIYALPVHDDPRYTYPVAQYDHDEGNAISGGFVYTGSILLLKGKYIFGDIVKGRVFYVESSELKFGHQAVIKEFDLQFNGMKSTFVDMVKNAKADLRFGMGEDNVLFIFTKTNGKMWKVADCFPN